MKSTTYGVWNVREIAVLAWEYLFDGRTEDVEEVRRLVALLFNRPEIWRDDLYTLEELYQMIHDNLSEPWMQEAYHTAKRAYWHAHMHRYIF